MARQYKRFKSITLLFLSVSVTLLLYCENNPVSPQTMRQKIFTFAAVNLDQYFIYREKLPSDLYDFATPVDLYESVDDKWTVFYPYERARIFLRSLTSTRVGLGIRFDSTAGGVTIVHVTPGSPAASAGLLKGDTIVSVDSVSIVDIFLSSLEIMLRGDEGTSVSLTIKRGSQQQTVRAVYASYKGETVYSELIDSTTAYIQLLSFLSKTIADSGSKMEFRQALDRYSFVKNLVLDLRGNGGGVVSQCLAIAGCFLPHKSRMVNRDYRDSSNGEFSTKKGWYGSNGDGAFSALKLYILVDNSSASASELLVAGLKANKDNVIVIGETTLGKACGQYYSVGPDSTVAKITTGIIYLTNGLTYHQTGIIPDIAVPAGEAKTKAIQMIGSQLAKKAQAGSRWSERCIDCQYTEPAAIIEESDLQLK